MIRAEQGDMTMKKLVTITLALVLSLSLAVPVLAAGSAKDFSDVEDGGR